MARLTSYINQNPSDNDLLTGSEFISIGQYKTGNYKLVDLATYFADFYLQNGSVYSLATISNSITLNATNHSALAAKNTSLSAKFGVYDINNNFTIDTSADYFDEVRTYADSQSAAASKITNLSATMGTFDGNNNFALQLSSGFKQAITTEVDANSATANNVSTLGAAIGINEVNGQQATQATAIVNGATNSTTTSTVNGALTDSPNLVISADNANLEVGQYVSGTGISTTNVPRILNIDSVNITLSKPITVADGATLTFTGTATVAIDNITGTIRSGFIIKGTGVAVGTAVSTINNNSLVMTKAENLADNTALTFLGIYAAVNEASQAIVDTSGKLTASYGLNVDANGNIASMKLLADETSSAISFSADSFKIYNGTSTVAPFEVVGGVVKIKSANIGSVAFGDLTGAPTTSFTTLVYATDANGTSPSLTKGTRTFYAIYQGSTAVDLNNLPSSLVFNPITGSTGASGADAKTIKLSTSALVVKYDSEGNNPSPSSITLTANSTNFNDGFFKFTGGGSHFTDETSYTDGTGQNQDTATITVPSTFSGFNSGAPIAMRVGVADGDQVEDAFDTINIAPVKEGSNGLTIVLSNAAHSVPADKDGTVPTSPDGYAGSGTDIVVFDGATEYNSVAHDATPGNNEFKVTTSVTTGTITLGAQDISANKVTFADHSAMTTDLAIIEYTINVENTTTIKKFQTLNKSKQGLTGATGGDGSAGTNARAVNLTATDLSFEYTAAGSTPNPSTVTVTATAVNTSGTVYYEFFKNDTTVTDANGADVGPTITNTYTYTPTAAYSNMPEKIEVQIREGATNSAILARDQITMVGIKPGANGTNGTSPYIAILTNEAHTLPATSTASGDATYTGSGTTIEVYRGTTELSSVAASSTPGTDEFSVTAAVSTTSSVDDISAGAITVSGNPAVVADHSDMVQNKATVTYTINCEDAVTLTKVQSLSKSLKGATGGTGGTGSPGSPGATGARSFSTYLFFPIPYTDSTNAANGPGFSTQSLSYSFSNNTFSGLPSVTVGGTAYTWSQSAPSATPGSGSNNYWHVQVTVVEGSPSNTISVGSVTRMFGFSGLVTFTGTSSNTLTDGTNNFNQTSIDGGAITTGTISADRIATGILRVGGNLTGTVDGLSAADIKSGAEAGATANQDSTTTILGGNLTGTVDGADVSTVKSGAEAGATAQQNDSDKTDGTVGGWTVDSTAIFSGTKDVSGFTAGGITINSGGSIHTKQFYIDTSGNAFFKGDLEAAGGTFAGNLEVTGTALIKGTDTTNNEFTAVKIINTGSTNGKVGMKLQNSSGYFAQFFLDTTSENNITNYGFDLQLGPASGGGVNTVSHFNAGGLCLPKGDVTVNSHSSAGGRSIFFNSDNAAEGPDTGRLHVNGYYKTFFFDIPTPLTTNPGTQSWANKGLVFRKWVVDSSVTGGGYRDEIIWVKPATNSLHVKGDIVASESSDKRLKDNIKPIPNAAEKINKIGGYEFDWNDNQELYEGHDVGVIAQEIEAVLPEVVETREDGYKAVDYKKIVPLLIEGIKDLQKQINELKKQ